MNTDYYTTLDTATINQEIAAVETCDSSPADPEELDFAALRKAASILPPMFKLPGDDPSHDAEMILRNAISRLIDAAERCQKAERAAERNKQAYDNVCIAAKCERDEWRQDRDHLKEQLAEAEISRSQVDLLTKAHCEIANERDEFKAKWEAEDREHQHIVDKLAAVRRECFPNKPCEMKGGLLEMRDEILSLRKDCDLWKRKADELLGQLQQKSKSFCSHCGKLFPKGREGVEQFRQHIAECNAHPMHPLAKQCRDATTERDRLKEQLAEALADRDRAKGKLEEVEGLLKVANTELADLQLRGLSEEQKAEVLWARDRLQDCWGLSCREAESLLVIIDRLARQQAVPWIKVVDGKRPNGLADNDKLVGVYVTFDDRLSVWCGTCNAWNFRNTRFLIHLSALLATLPKGDERSTVIGCEKPVGVFTKADTRSADPKVE
jgi:hypothetical protein